MKRPRWIVRRWVGERLEYYSGRRLDWQPAATYAWEFTDRRVAEAFVAHVGGELEELSALRAARSLGRRGGSQRSPAKTEASRKNGRLGGRPRKEVTP